jgi:hypothetical protein
VGGGVSQSVVNSTITGLGTFAYISSTQLFSTVTSLTTTPKALTIQTFIF